MAHIHVVCKGDNEANSYMEMLRKRPIESAVVGPLLYQAGLKDSHSFSDKLSAATRMLENGPLCNITCVYYNFLISKLSNILTFNSCLMWISSSEFH